MYSPLANSPALFKAPEMPSASLESQTGCGVRFHQGVKVLGHPILCGGIVAHTELPAAVV